MPCCMLPWPQQHYNGSAIWQYGIAYGIAHAQRMDGYYVVVYRWWGNNLFLAVTIAPFAYGIVNHAVNSTSSMKKV